MDQTRKAIRKLLCEAESSWLGSWWLMPDGTLNDFGEDWSTHALEAYEHLPKQHPGDPAVAALVDDLGSDPNFSENLNAGHRVEKMALERGWIRGFNDSVTVHRLTGEILARLQPVLRSMSELGDTVFIDVWDTDESLEVASADLLRSRMSPAAIRRRAKHYR